MIVTLIRKELHEHRAFFVVACLLFSGTTLADVLWSVGPDHYDFTTQLIVLSPDPFLTGLIVLFAVTVAMGLVGREFEDRTILFLDGLPTTRDAIFLAKVTVALLLLAVGPLSSLVLGWSTWFVAGRSLDASFYVWPTLPMTLLLVAAAWSAFTLALLMSYLQRLGWLLVAAILLGLKHLGNTSTAAQLLAPMTLGVPVFHGVNLVIPWRALVLQGVVGTTSLGLSWLLFRGLGERITLGIQALPQRRGGGVAMGAVGVIAVAVWMGLLFGTTAGNKRDRPAIASQSWAVGRTVTQHYRITWPGELATRASALSEKADGTFRFVESTLGTDAQAPLDVDATGTGSANHFDGLTDGSAIRLNLTEQADIDKVNVVLAHETVHALADRMSASRLREFSRWTSWFNEGTAEWVEDRLRGDPQRTERATARAAVQAHVLDLRFAEILAGRVLTEAIDPDVIYPIGESVVTVLASTRGASAPGLVLAAMGRADRPTDLAGGEVMRDAMQAAGFNLNALADAWHLEMTAVFDQLPAWAHAVREPDVELTQAEGQVWVISSALTQGTADTAEPTLKVRFRRTGDLQRAQWKSATAEPDGLHARRLVDAHDHAEMQLGLYVPELDAVIWWRWRAVDLGDLPPHVPTTDESKSSVE